MSGYIIETDSFDKEKSGDRKDGNLSHLQIGNCRQIHSYLERMEENSSDSFVEDDFHRLIPHNYFFNHASIEALKVHSSSKTSEQPKSVNRNFKQWRPTKFNVYDDEWLPGKHTIHLHNGITKSTAASPRVHSSFEIPEQPKLVHLNDKQLRANFNISDHEGADLPGKRIINVQSGLTESTVIPHKVSNPTQDLKYFQRDTFDGRNDLVSVRENCVPQLCNSLQRNTMHMARERERRETHNKIERKRRSFINNKIAELGNLLPGNMYRPLQQGKGSILKGTVEYVKALKKDVKHAKQLEAKISELETEFRKMAARLERVDMDPDDFDVSDCDACTNKMSTHTHTMTSVDNCQARSIDSNTDNSTICSNTSYNEYMLEIFSLPDEIENSDNESSVLSSTLTDDSSSILPPSTLSDDNLWTYY